MNYQIRRVKPEEAPALSKIAFGAKAYWGYPERWMEIWRPQLTFSPQDFEGNESWVIETNGQPVAFCNLQETEGSAWLEDLWVAPEFIGQGVGKRLFLHAVEESRQRGYRTLRLEADPHAVGFYEKMGMHKIGERYYEIEGQPRILPIMEMKL
jgi:ribosomal protein S18 acetylase RimI-like enzyme